MDEIKQLSEDIRELNKNFREYLQYMKTSTDAKSWQEIPRGEIKTKKFGDYYDKHFVTSQAVASNPNDFDSPLYNINYTDPTTLATTTVRGATVLQETERYSDIIYVYNDGTTYDANHYLYVIVSHGTIGLGHEEFIKPGESKAFYNISELRFRSPTLGLAFRVSEYCIEQTCCPAAANTTSPVTISGQPISTTISGQPISITQTKTLITSGSGTLASIAASTESLIVDALDVSTGTILELQLTGTFNAAATAGATVNLYASVDGTTYDTVANANTVWVTAINNPVSAGNARTKTSNPIDVSGLKKVKIYVANQDAAQTLTSVTVRYALWK